MCQYSADRCDGIPNDWHLAHYGSLSTGGSGLIMVEATAVLPEGRISPQDLGLWNSEQTLGFTRMLEFLHQNAPVIGIQLAHSGRKGATYRPWENKAGSIPISEGGWMTVAPSALSFGSDAVPHELSTPEVMSTIDAFVRSAKRAIDAGFDLVEIQAAHGYLVHEFLSPLTNKRSDEYGGSLINRARVLLEIVAGVRAAIGGDIPLLVRLSATDWVAGGFEGEEVTQVAQWSHQAGADFLDITTGGLVPEQQIDVGPHYQVPHAQRVKQVTDLPVSGVGLITDAKQADEAIRAGHVDAVFMARQMLRNPRFPLQAAAELQASVRWPPAYERAQV